MSLSTTRRLTLYTAAGTAIAAAALSGGDPQARAGCTPAAAVLSPQGTGTGALPSLSAGGRFMAFESSANDLVPGDSGQTDIFVFDRLTCVIERVSVNSTETAANASSFDPAISGGGRFVVFESLATNLAPDSNGFTRDIFVRDRQLGTTSLVSLAFDGTQGALDSTDAEISGDGQVVVFISASTTLVPNDTNNEADVFVRDLAAGTTERVSISSAGTQGDSPSSTGVFDPVLSTGGRYVAFAAVMNTLVTDDFNNTTDVFVRDRVAGTTVRASVSTAGFEGDAPSTSPSISGDGSIVAFAAPASSDLVPGDGTCDGIYVRDLGLGATTCLPLRPPGGFPSSNAHSPSISRDGRYVGFISSAAYVAGDSGFNDDVYVHDRQTGISRRASVNALGLASDATLTFLSGRVDLSGDGQFIAFASNGTNLVPSDTNGETDVFVAAWPGLPDPPFINTVRNGAFTSALQDWQTFATPDPSFIVTQFTGGVLEFFRQPPPPGTTNQAVVFQNTTSRFLAHSAIEASMDLGNSSSVRKRMTVLLHEADFSDLAVCTFWLPPNAPLRTYIMRSHTTQFWTNASISFFASTAGSDGGFYRVDNVSLYAVPGQDDDRTDCVDPLAPPPPGGAAGPELLVNGGFDSGSLSWVTFGQIVSQIANGVFEFYRPAGTPAGVVTQQTGTSIAANEILTANFYLGNSSSVRKRVTVLLHEANFSDLSACTFWLPPGLPLAPYRMRTYPTQAWTNAVVSVYPSIVGDDEWIRLDNVSLQVTPAATTDGTNCLEPGADILRALQRTAAIARAAPPRAGSPRVALPSAAGAGTFSAGGVAGGTLTVWQDVVDLTQASGARLLFESQLRASRSRALVEVSVDGVEWQTLASVPSSDDWQTLAVDLGALAGQIVHVRIVFDARAIDDALAVRDVSVVLAR